MLISSIAAAVITLALLGSVSAFAKSEVNKDSQKHMQTRSVLPQGYDYDTVTNKYNLLFGIVSDGELSDISLVCLDKDKCTLDVLVLPTDSELSCDGFLGTIADAYHTEIFKELLTRALMLDIDDAEFISADDYAALLAALDVSALEQLPNRLIQLGSLKFCSLASGILINGLWGNLTVSDIIDLAGYIDKISQDSIGVYYAAALSDKESLADVLNKHFRIKGSTVSSDELGITIK